jgi:hypothetical protein
MHDLDRTSREVNDEALQHGQFGYGQFEHGPFGYGAFEFEPELPGGTYGRPFSEAELDELALELLQVRDEHELDQFLGSLLSKAARAVGKFVRSPAGVALKGILKNAVTAAVPVLSAAVPGLGALGLLRGGGVGTALGAAIKSELDWEGGPDDKHDVEAAKKVLAVGGNAAQQVAAMPPNAPPQAAVEAVQSAAQQQGVSADSSPAQPGRSDSPLASGTWYRRGRTIIVVGL